MAAMIQDGRHTYRPQTIGRVFGWFFLATFVFSIPAFFVGYHHMLNNPSWITGSGVIPPRASRSVPRRRFCSSSSTSQRP